MTNFYRQFEVPLVFWRDHMNRDLVTHSGPLGEWNHLDGHYVGGYEIGRTKTGIIVRLHEDDIDELYSDAEHYATFTGSDFQDNFGLCGSARATVKRIQKLRAS